jgi:hypothetical protein
MDILVVDRYAGSCVCIVRRVRTAHSASRSGRRHHLTLSSERALVPTLADIPVPIAIVPALLFLFASFVIAGTRRLHGRLQFGHALSFALVALGVAFCATWGTLERSRTDVRTLLSYSAARVTDARRVAYVRLAIARASALQSAVSTATNEFEDGATSERETLRLIGAPSDIALVRLKKFHAPFSGLSKLAITIPAFESYELVEPPRYAREFITLHENAHLAGFERESDANVIAFLSATRSVDTRAAYQAWILLASTLSTETRDLSIHDSTTMIRNDIFAGRLLLGFDSGSSARLDYNAFADVILGADPDRLCRVDSAMCDPNATQAGSSGTSTAFR